MTLTLNDLYGSPDHYLQAFDGDAAIFVPMDRAAYHRSIFLDGRIDPAGGGSMRVPVAMLAGAVPRPAATGWIFHVAHCGSTLLARALDLIGETLVLREPLALRQLAFAPADARLAIVAAMLSKRYRPDVPTLVKANVPVNFLLPRVAVLAPDARALFLHLPLRDYLLAILRSDAHRTWLRNVTTQLAPHLGTMTGWPDAERAAALWLAQMNAYAAAATLLPAARSLDAERCFTQPLPVLVAAARHFGLTLPEATLRAVVDGSLFATYSKNPDKAFDNAARLALRRENERALGPELAQAERWIGAHGATADAATRTLAAIALDG
jgi:hypothetical protein